VVLTYDIVRLHFLAEFYEVIPARLGFPALMQLVEKCLYLRSLLRTEDVHVLCEIVELRVV
jgi:hypothetical protein